LSNSARHSVYICTSIRIVFFYKLTFFVQSESLRTEEYHNVDGQKSRQVTDVSSTNASLGEEERQTSFFERTAASDLYRDYRAGRPGLVFEENSRKSSSSSSAVETNVRQQQQQQVVHVSRQARKQIAPRFVSAPQGKIAVQREDVYLDAIIDGHPPADVTWWKNGVELVADGVKLNITSGHNTSRLDIRRLAVEDGGQYTCKAVNAAGSTSCTTDIIVKSKRDSFGFQRVCV